MSRKCALCDEPAETGSTLCAMCDLYRVLRNGGYNIVGLMALKEAQASVMLSRCPRHGKDSLIIIDGHEICKACLDEAENGKTIIA